jgi:integrase/recombinase XerC
VTTARHDDTADDEAVLTLPEAMDAFFVARRPRKDSPHTAKAYASDLRGIGELLARATGAPLNELTVADLTVPRLRSAFAAFADTHAKGSINRCWSTWNQLFTFLVAEGYREGNPMPGIAKAKLPRRLPKPLTGEDTPERLLEAAAVGRRRARNPWPERDLAVLATLLLTGLRSAELLDLRLDSLAGRLGERRLHVIGKGGRARSVPVEPPLEAVLDAYLASRRARLPRQRLGRRAALFVDTRGQPLQRGGLQYLVSTTLRWAGLNDRRARGALVHALRHTFATRLAEDGATAIEIMNLLGHASLTTSQAYIDATAREQRDAARANRTYQALAHLASTDDAQTSECPRTAPANQPGSGGDAGELEDHP